MIGFVGIGNMGLAMALRLRDRGHAVAVCDIDAAAVARATAAGASAAAAPAALGGCDCVVVAVVDGAQTRAVVAALAAALRPGAAVLLCPTIAPADVEATAALLAARGIGCIDAPMSGGPARARDGTMSLMVACDDALFARWQPLLHTLAAHCFRVGIRPGDGARTKLVNNLLAAVNLAGAAEAFALAERFGLDPARTLAVVEQSSGQSWIGSDRLRRAIAGDTAPRAHMMLLAKDAALALAASNRAELPVATAAARQFAAAVAAGLGGADDAALWPFVSRRPSAPESAP